MSDYTKSSEFIKCSNAFIYFIEGIEYIIDNFYLVEFHKTFNVLNVQQPSSFINIFNNLFERSSLNDNDFSNFKGDSSKVFNSFNFVINNSNGNTVSDSIDINSLLLFSDFNSNTDQYACLKNIASINYNMFLSGLINPLELVVYVLYKLAFIQIGYNFVRGNINTDNSLRDDFVICEEVYNSLPKNIKIDIDAIYSKWTNNLILSQVNHRVDSGKIIISNDYLFCLFYSCIQYYQGLFLKTLSSFIVNKKYEDNIFSKRNKGVIIKLFKDFFKKFISESSGIFHKFNLQQSFKTLKESDTEMLNLPPNPNIHLGCYSLLSRSKRRIFEILSSYSLSYFEAEQIEESKYNFDILNIPSYHPSRANRDTFYIDSSKNELLRTHTTSFQGRFLESIDYSNFNGFGIFTIGECYRRDNSDSTHLPYFNQVDLFCVNKYESSNIFTLHNIVVKFLSDFFSKSISIEFTKDYFPFTSPSYGINMKCFYCFGKSDKCSICSGFGFLEVGGCGVSHNNILKKFDIDCSIYQGVAFGIGVERLTMIKYNINDIRNLYSSSKCYKRF